MAKARTQKETVAILQKTYPKFNKVAASMAAHPEKYGICLTKEAKKALGEEKKKDNRKKSKQLTVRVDGDVYDVLKDICKQRVMTVQDWIEEAIIQEINSEV